MRRFSPSEAAFEGFRLLAHRPGSAFAWMLLNLLGVLLLGALLWSVAEPNLPILVGLLHGETADFARLQGAQGSLDVFNRFSQIITYVVLVMINCAVYRAVLYPEDRGLGFLRVGGDEFRVGVVKFAFNLGGAFVGVFVFLLLFLSMLAYFSATREVGGPIPLLLLIIGAVTLVPLIVVGTRLSLAEVMTFDRQRLQFFDSWALTRAVFWPMLGAYVLAALMSLVVMLALLVVAGVGLAIWWAFTPVLHSGPRDWASIEPYALPAGAIWLTAGTLVGTVSRVIMTGPAAYIYAVLTEPESGDAPAAMSSTALVL